MAQEARSRAIVCAPSCRKNPHWRKAFIQQLALTSDVSCAARAARVCEKTVYQAKANDPKFAENWQAALEEGYARLEMELLRRLRHGDQQAADETKYDFANAMRLLNYHRESAATAQSIQRSVTAEEIRASIDRKIEDIRSRVKEPRAPQEDES